MGRRADLLARVATACGWQAGDDPAWPWRIRVDEGWMQAKTVEAAVEAELEGAAMRTGYLTVQTLEERDPVEHHRRQATGQQKRADRLKRDLAALHATHAREKRGRRKVEQRLTARTRERDELSRRVVKAERACEDLRRERDNLVESRDDRDSTIRRLIRENEINVIELRAKHDEAIATLQREAARAIESEVELKLAAVRVLADVRVLRRAMRNAISALGSIRSDGEGASTISGAREHLRDALAAVIDPDDGNPH